MAQWLTCFLSRLISWTEMYVLIDWNGPVQELSGYMKILKNDIGWRKGGLHGLVAKMLDCFVVLVVRISETKLDDFYHSGFSDYWLNLYCYIHFSVNVSSSLLQKFLVETIMPCVLSRLHGVTVIGVGSLCFWVTIIWTLRVQSWLQVSSNTRILNTCTWLWLMESEQLSFLD